MFTIFDIEQEQHQQEYILKSKDIIYNTKNLKDGKLKGDTQPNGFGKKTKACKL